ncbi:hypothetical protein ARMGADRAFT_1004405 [Armillaria gallica]|uniref:Uncharacterized protein n=1 Tax=Armillaria gallica TaxID=47427 RepID=A0A2H3EBK0_ARMGA|nr:hypothetical protein ARMGADRAFT_1004405 [Armillaria gallica]
MSPSLSRDEGREDRATSFAGKGGRGCYFGTLIAQPHPVAGAGPVVDSFVGDSALGSITHDAQHISDAVSPGGYNEVRHKAQECGYNAGHQAQVPKKMCPFIRDILAGHPVPRRRFVFTQDMQPFFDAPEYPDFRVYATGNTLKEIKLYVAHTHDLTHVYELSDGDVEHIPTSSPSALGSDTETQDHGHKFEHPQEQASKEGTLIDSQADDDGLIGAVRCFLCEEVPQLAFGTHISQQHSFKTRNKTFCPSPMCNIEFTGLDYTRHFMKHCEWVEPLKFSCQSPLCDYRAPVGRRDLLKRHTDSCRK